MTTAKELFTMYRLGMMAVNREAQEVITKRVAALTGEDGEIELPAPLLVEYDGQTVDVELIRYSEDDLTLYGSYLIDPHDQRISSDEQCSLELDDLDFDELVDLLGTLEGMESADV